MSYSTTDMLGSLTVTKMYDKGSGRLVGVPKIVKMEYCWFKEHR